MSEYILLISIIVLVSTMTSILLVLQIQRHRYRVLSTQWEEWKNAQTRTQQIWETQQEKHIIELEHTLATHVQHVENAWRMWEAKDISLIASTAQECNATLMHVHLEQELARLLYTDEVPLEKLD